MEFHISRSCRDTYSFDETLFTISGNVIFPDFHAVRLFAYAMNNQRDLARHPEKAVRAGQLNAMGLIDEILHYVVELYREQINGGVMADALAYLEEHLGEAALAKTLETFAHEFPTVAAYREQIPAADYLRDQTGGVSHREIALEEMLMLWLANLNPAFSPFGELFHDARLREQTVYSELMEHLADFFEAQPPFGPDDDNLIDMLRRPARQHPHSLTAQLGYMREKWGILLQKYLLRLLSGLDLVREEEKMGFLGPGPTTVLEFGKDALTAQAEPERFSPDLHWMPRVVLIAKCTFVWLDQLSRQYGRPIERLDQIPDEELDRLARWGFTGLWLIGLWERSRASRKIKQLCGNPEALASAYSLLDYRVSDELGGEAALEHLRRRAWQRGIRLAGDMVPNHMGIDSPWLVDHPDWFIQLDHPPYPAYSFNGVNLSADDRVGIYLEDHYYDRTDAAVVFKLEEHGSGRTRYVYHGNDGTSMPWNDTAQLNYLLPEVREAVIRTILDVARRFPIIRFDAAMTLTKRHYQRLWFPEPGSGGDIPTRADKGISREEFNRHMPEEFWREVVDRVAAEAPDTLLLAEAFWLMEGYFVRSLGMHRVYNSAFMNMLKNEENQKFRYTIKNVLEFNP
ncbi:MAG: alpha-amylase, partial [Acidobacteria bacterium]|nr:alpha-amylase [Acidobacteriota bacterium]